MSDDKELRVKITTPSDTSGLRQTASELQNVHAATKNLQDKTKEAGKDTDKFTLSQHELRHVMADIGDSVAPGMGHALEEAAYGPIGIALMLGAAFESVREAIKKTSDELDEIGKRAAQAFAEVQANLFDAIRGQEFDPEKITRYFDAIKDGATHAKQAISDMTELLHEQNKAALEINAALEANLIARVKLKAAADPNFTPSQQAIAISNIQKGFSAAGQSLSQSDLQADVDAKRQQLAALQKSLDDTLMAQHRAEGGGNNAIVQKQIETAMQTAPEGMKKWFAENKDSLDVSKVGTDAALKNWQEVQTRLEDDKTKDTDRAKTLSDKIAPYEDLLTKIATGNTGGIAGWQIGKAMLGLGTTSLGPEDAKRILGDKANADQQVKLDAQNLEAAKQAVARLEAQKTTLDEFSKSVTDLTKQVIDAQEALKHATEMFGTRSQSLATTSGIKSDTAATETLKTLFEQGGFAASFETNYGTAKGIADKFESGKSTSVEQDGFLLQFTNAAGAQAQTLKQAADWLEKNLGNNDQVLAVVERIIAIQSRTQAVTGQTQQAVNALEAKMTALERFASYLSTRPQTGGVPPQ